MAEEREASAEPWLAEEKPASFRPDDSECSTVAEEGDLDQRLLIQEVGSPLPGGVAEAKVPLPLESLRDSCFIIFDWDDTLLPTSFVTDAIKICPPKYGGAAVCRRNGPRRGNVRVGGGSKLSKDFPCYEALCRQALLVEELLRSARGLARVAIVTSATRPWVFESAEQYLPGLDLPGLLRELQIPVYYAHEHQRQELGGLDLEAACKRNAMAEFLQQASAETSSPWNVLSVGDSLAEKDAAKAVTRWDPLSATATRPLCKTVKLMADPSLKQLAEELQLLTKQLERLACYGGDADLCITEPEDFVTQLDALFGC